MLACWRKKDMTYRSCWDGSVVKEVDGKSNEVLDGVILGVIRFWMKSRWVVHSSMSVDGNASCRCSKGRQVQRAARFTIIGTHREGKSCIGESYSFLRIFCLIFCFQKRYMWFWLLTFPARWKFTLPTRCPFAFTRPPCKLFLRMDRKLALIIF